MKVTKWLMSILFTCLVATALAQADLPVGALNAAPPQFLDAPPPGFWATEGLEIAVANGIIVGRPDGTFDGYNSLNRYEAAVIIARLIEYIDERFNLLDSEIAVLRRAIGELESVYGDLGVRIATLESMLAGKADRSELAGKADQEEVDALNARIDELALLVNQLQAQANSGVQVIEGPRGPQGAQGEPGPVGATGPQGPQGPQGTQGEPGPAGANGANGPAGPSGPAGPTGLTGPAGPVGPAGPIGPEGAMGPAGNMWFAGVGSPDDSVGNDSDYYLDNDSGDVYQKAAGSWSLATNLRGPAGVDGADGADGAPGVAGADGSSFSVNRNPFYFGGGAYAKPSENNDFGFRAHIGHDQLFSQFVGIRVSGDYGLIGPLSAGIISISGDLTFILPGEFADAYGALGAGTQFGGTDFYEAFNTTFGEILIGFELHPLDFIGLFAEGEVTYYFDDEFSSFSRIVGGLNLRF